MPYDSTNKKLYVDTSVTPNVGISLDDIAACLRDYRVNTSGRRDLGLLATSPNVNRWAKYKPFIAAADNDHPYGVQTLEDRKNAAYGFAWWNRDSTDANAPIATSAEALMDKALALNGEWVYNKPTTRFRVQDFDQYNHLAKQPYDYQNLTPIGYTQKYVKVLLEPNNAKNEILLSDMPNIQEAGDILTDYRIVALYRLKGSTGEVNVATDENNPITVADLDAFETMEALELNFSPVLDGSTKVYDLIWAATNAYDNTDNPIWIYLGNSLDEIKLAASFYAAYEAGAGYFEAFDTNGIEIEGSSSAIVGSINPYIEGANNLDYALEVQFTTKIWDSTETDGYSVAQTLTETETISAESGFTYGPSIDIDIAGISATATNMLITMDIQFRRASSNEAWTYRHFDFLNNKLNNYASTESDGVSVLSIINYIESL